jgi:hypothetical protein
VWPALLGLLELQHIALRVPAVQHDEAADAPGALQRPVAAGVRGRDADGLEVGDDGFS